LITAVAEADLVKDSVGLVNIVRQPEHVDLLKKLGAAHV
jgi:hypothetical protein